MNGKDAGNGILIIHLSYAIEGEGLCDLMDLRKKKLCRA